jgi:hypothetical protein
MSLSDCSAWRDSAAFWAFGSARGPPAGVGTNVPAGQGVRRRRADSNSTCGSKTVTTSALTSRLLAWLP